MRLKLILSSYLLILFSLISVFKVGDLSTRPMYYLTDIQEKYFINENRTDKKNLVFNSCIVYIY